MAGITLALPRPRLRRTDFAKASAWRVELLRDWDHVAPRWQAAREAGAAATPFQSVQWLDSLYAAIKADPAIEPMIAWIEDAASGAFAMALPLLRHAKGGATHLSFADLGMSDFNAPLLGAAAPQSRGEALAAWTALRRVLPRADIIHFEKMPPRVEGRINPLALLGGVRDCAVNGNLIETGEDFDAWRFSLPRSVRKELERNWRVFTRHDDARFELIENPDEALRVLETMEVQQQARLAELGLEYKLGHPVIAGCYREVLARHAASGFAALGVLKSGDEIVAALLGLRDRDTLVLVRLTHGGKEWATCSPGRLAISRLMGEMHARGVRKFDFSVGNYAYKRRFGPVPQPLVDLSTPRSLRGVPVHLRLIAGAVLRRYPELRQRLRRALGKDVPPGEFS